MWTEWSEDIAATILQENSNGDTDGTPFNSKAATAERLAHVQFDLLLILVSVNGIGCKHNYAKSSWFRFFECRRLVLVETARATVTDAIRYIPI